MQKKTIKFAILSTLYLTSTVNISGKPCLTNDVLYPFKDNCGRYISCKDEIIYVDIFSEGLRFNSIYASLL